MRIIQNNSDYMNQAKWLSQQQQPKKKKNQAKCDYSVNNVSKPQYFFYLFFFSSFDESVKNFIQTQKPELQMALTPNTTNDNENFHHRHKTNTFTRQTN